MKKINSYLSVICICIMVLLSVGQCVVFADSQATQSVSSTSDSKSVDILDLVRLKKYLMGMRSTLAGADYNKDGSVNALDLVTLKRLIFDMPINSDNKVEETVKFDKDGYYNQVVKP